MSKQKCPLCESTSTLFFQDDRSTYFICDICKGIFLKQDQILSSEDEKAYYDTHNNDIEDLRYQNFVSPITTSVIKKHPTKHIGLDFGCGNGPVITHILKHHGYQMNLYDPFYQPNQTALEQTYDFIVCCEVMEHFSDPNKEFEKLHKLLKPKGALYCMTWLYDETIDFESWFYRKDPTHVFFYQKETISFIANHFSFKSFQINNRLITFQR